MNFIQIKEMLIEANSKIASASIIYEKIAVFLKDNSISINKALMQVIFNGDEVKFRELNTQYRNKKADMKAEDLQLFRLYSSSAMGLSRARQKDIILADIEYYAQYLSMDKTEVERLKEKGKKGLEEIISQVPQNLKQMIKPNNGKEKGASGTQKVTQKSDVSISIVETVIEKTPYSTIFDYMVKRAMKEGNERLAELFAQVENSITGFITAKPVETVIEVADDDAVDFTTIF